ncbi:MAG: hypothetical protein LIP08_03060 [Bacteroides sp.]|nr:hypothetical protein [Bacteroides sp.]
MQYIQKNIGFYESGELGDNYKVGTTLEEYQNGAYIPLSKKQIKFRKDNPGASPVEVLSMELNPVPERTLEEMIQAKVMEIDQYDSSEAVNSFLVNGVSAWLTPDIRSNYKNSIESAELLGETEITISIAGMVANLSLQEAKIMLARIQRYADKATIVTEMHKLNVSRLETSEAVTSYDHTLGYLEQLKFTLTPTEL